MSLHKEISFETEICEHLSAHGWLYAEGDAAGYVRARALFPEGRFLEIHVDCDLETLRQRDTKGLYERAEKGAVRNLTGVHAAYEPPTDPEVVLDSGTGDLATQVSQLVSVLNERGVIGDGGGV